MLIEKKTRPKYFQAILDGKKNYEFRLADWECNEGDTLLLREWDPETKDYTGREVRKKVTYVAKFKIDHLPWPKEDVEKHGLQVISLE
jgi:predicted transcriptional regulator